MRPTSKFPTRSNAAGTKAEPRRNHRGTTHGLPVPAMGGPFRGPQPAEPIGTATSIPYGMTADELLDCCGPSWRGMTPDHRATYPRMRHVVAIRATRAA
ncbi:MAG: hypothetical protein JWL61_4961 [Gemmatimonadetes bacterium]|nr:hypothetical protein [Gemmatimonadota bacterium]